MECMIKLLEIQEKAIGKFFEMDDEQRADFFNNAFKLGDPNEGLVRETEQEFIDRISAEYNNYVELLNIIKKSKEESTEWFVSILFPYSNEVVSGGTDKDVLVEKRKWISDFLKSEYHTASKEIGDQFLFAIRRENASPRPHICMYECNDFKMHYFYLDVDIEERNRE